MKRLILISAIILASSCASTLVVQNPLPLPEPLVLPLISGNELMCLADETFEDIVKRDKLLRARIETLRDIIKGTHDSDK